MSATTRYIPPLSFNWLTPFYDRLFKWIMREEELRTRLVTQIQVEAGMRVLDLGCGTGSLTLLVKQFQPSVEVFGIDVDLQALEIARKKAQQEGTKIAFERASATQLPYPNGYFDRVFSSLMLHHLDRAEKHQAFSEVRRVLKPGGEFHVVDFGVPYGAYAWLISQVMRRLERADDNIQGLLSGLIREAGFIQVIETGHLNTLVGSVSYFKAKKGEE